MRKAMFWIGWCLMIAVLEGLIALIADGAMRVVAIGASIGAMCMGLAWTWMLVTTIQRAKQSRRYWRQAYEEGRISAQQLHERLAGIR